jgi:hypothetical protein
MDGRKKCRLCEDVYLPISWEGDLCPLHHNPSTRQSDVETKPQAVPALPVSAASRSARQQKGKTKSKVVPESRIDVVVNTTVIPSDDADSKSNPVQYHISRTCRSCRNSFFPTEQSRVYCKYCMATPPNIRREQCMECCLANLVERGVISTSSKQRRHPLDRL